MKHYKSVELLCNFRMSSPLNKRIAPNIENFLATVLDLCNVDYAVHIAVLTTKYEYVQHKYTK